MKTDPLDKKCTSLQVSSLCNADSSVRYTHKYIMIIISWNTIESALWVLDRGSALPV
jgi:hypothetical protein